MDATVTGGERSVSTEAHRRSAWRRVWPVALAVVVAAATAYGLADGRAAAPVVAASGLVYLAAAATARRWAAWAAFGFTFLLVTVDKFADLDATLWILVAAAVMLGAGLARHRTRPWWSMPLQAAAMLVLGATALVAVRVDATIGGLLIAAALLAHAGWDVHHHRSGRVVDRSLATFCAVLDVLVAGCVVAVALSS